jgi:hypothetical protein
MCHESARKEKNERGRNGDESLGDESLARDRDILWKTFPMSSEQAYDAPLIAKSPEKYRLSCLFTVKPSCRHGGAAVTADKEQAYACNRQNKMAGKYPAETKDPSGGTTGRVKLYGRWGGWALAPDTASLGRDYRSHINWSRGAGETFKAPAAFFNFRAGFSGANYRAAE